jgi:hypothetical protein
MPKNAAGSFYCKYTRSQVGNQLRRITAGCVIVFEMFRRNGYGTFYVAVKIGGDSKIMLGLGAISFDEAFSFAQFSPSW